MILSLYKDGDFMDNIIIEKTWRDSDLVELKIIAKSEYVKANQNCYVEAEAIIKISDKIETYIKNHKVECYLEFGNKTGNFTPAFSLTILPSQTSGHVKVEVDIEIADNDKRAHRCCFYVNCELGQIERFGKALRSIVTEEEKTVISLT